MPSACTAGEVPRRALIACARRPAERVPGRSPRDTDRPAGPSVTARRGGHGLLPCQLIVKESRLNRSPLPPLKTKYSLCVPPGSVTGALTVV